MGKPTRTQRLLTPLRDSIIDKPPCTSGTLPLPESCFSLFYKATGDGHDARHINLAEATLDELDQLAQACDPASFGVNENEVLDETYRKAGKMDAERFSSPLQLVHTDLMKIIRGCLLEGTQSTEPIADELHKLNVYSKGSFFKPHVDTPRSQKMFGSLVVVFPTPHEGGALILRHRGQEWTFDSGRGLASVREPSIGYVAFFSDVEHEVAPVISGHRVTLTYNLYFDDNGGTVSSSKEAASRHPSLPPALNKNAFRETFQALLENPEFLPAGGTLAFGMRHVYPIPHGKGDLAPLEPIYGALKGSDAAVYETARALGLQPVLYMYYESEKYDSNISGAVIDKVLDSSEWGLNQDSDTISVLLDEGGIGVCEGEDPGRYDDEYENSKNMERVEWVTPVTTFNRHQSVLGLYGNQPSLEMAYADLCMFVRIGKAGERLLYPSVSQLKKEWERVRANRRW